MRKIKVLSIVGTRPEIIRLSCTLKKLDDNESIDHTLIHTGQNYDYELNQVFFKDLGLRKPDYFLEAAAPSPSETIGNIFIAIDKIFDKENPDCVLILGDTNSCLCSIPAKKRKIPVFHMEAGNRCFDSRVPEELNRKIVDHISDINLTYSTIARDYLIREGISPDRIIKTGSPMKEVLNTNKDKIIKSTILSKLELNKKGYFLVSAHREENIESDKNLLKLIQSLNSLCEIYNKPVIVSTHPRTRNAIQRKKIQIDSRIRLEKPFGFNDYNNLQMNALVVLSDSGTITEESSILNFNAINIREAHERPEGMEEAAVIMTGVDQERIVQAIKYFESTSFDRESFEIVKDYDIENVSDKIVRIIISHLTFINQVVWKKYE